MWLADHALASTASTTLTVKRNRIEYSGATEPLERSKIIFHGDGNTVILEDGAHLRDTTLQLHGNNSVVYICASPWPVYLNANIFHDSVLFVGKNCSFNGKLQLSLSERKHIIIGSDCIFSYGISIRTSDPHLIYSADSSQRTNPSKSVVVGDHVWIAEDVRLLKGSAIGSGSLVGVRSVVTKPMPSNMAIVGTPGRPVGKPTFWKRPSVHAYSPQDTHNSMTADGREFIYDCSARPRALLDTLDRLESLSSSGQRLEWCKNTASSNDKNRFALAEGAAQAGRAAQAGNSTREEAAHTRSQTERRASSELSSARSGAPHHKRRWPKLWARGRTI